MNHDQILNNVDSLTADQLFDFISQGIVTLDELRATGNLDATKRRAIQSLQTQRGQKDNDAWQKAEFGTEIDLRGYISNFPAGKHVEDAKRAIKRLQDLEREKIRKKRGILDKLRTNPNSYSPYEINDYLSNGTIEKYDLINCGVPENIIDSINNISQPYLELGNAPESIPDGYTEVYFWGIPGSGKTCALAALLSTAHKKGYLNIATGPGYDYMTRLKNIFIVDNAFLPPPSPVETTQYLPFTLKKTNESNVRSISLIELSGEIFQCFYYKNASKSLPSQSHQDTFNSLNSFLRDKNRKIHFFFIDYDKENKTDADGYTQSDYLEAASTYFKNNEVFGKTTDAVYVVLTKSDLLPCSRDERVAMAKEHLQSPDFASFINTLKDNCKKHSINAGKLTVEPFSLGKVYFQQICNFDNYAATKIIDILFDRIAPSKKSILDVFNK